MRNKNPSRRHILKITAAAGATAFKEFPYIKSASSVGKLGDEKQIIVGYPAPAESAAIVYAQTLLPTLVARVTQGGESFDDAIDWVANGAELVSRG